LALPPFAFKVKQLVQGIRRKKLTLRYVDSIRVRIGRWFACEYVPVTTMPHYGFLRAGAVPVGTGSWETEQDQDQRGLRLRPPDHIVVGFGFKVIHDVAVDELPIDSRLGLKIQWETGIYQSAPASYYGVENSVNTIVVSFLSGVVDSCDPRQCIDVCEAKTFFRVLFGNRQRRAFQTVED
jgi:hypothetical protein